MEKSEFFYLIQIFRVGWNFNRRRWETFQTPQAHLNITSETNEIIKEFACIGIPLDLSSK